MKVPRIIKLITEDIVNIGGSAYIVGGAVRDHVLGIEPKDHDIEVFGVQFDTLIYILARFGDVNIFGKSFGVIKFTCPNDDEYDFSLPRKDSKTGIGHKNFEITFDPDMTLQEASERRDFTINALYYDIRLGKIIDLHHAKVDFENKTLRRVGCSFADDVLRPLRAMQFAARFEFDIDPYTAKVCESLIMEYHTLPKERIWEEWFKWASKSKKPSLGLKVLQKTGWLAMYDFNEMHGLRQSETHHPEGDVFQHTCHVVDAAQKIASRESLDEIDTTILLFSALCHDLGKLITTVINEDGSITSYEHDKEGYHFAKCFMTSIGAPQMMVDAVATLVREHMIHICGKMTPRIIRRLSVRLDGKTTIKMLSHLIEADHSGRPPLPAIHPCPELLQIANELNVQTNKPESYLMGRHLIDLGLKPGAMFGELISECYSLQMDGKINSTKEAIAWATGRCQDGKHCN